MLWTEIVMGRFWHGPILLWAEMTRNPAKLRNKFRNQCMGPRTEIRNRGIGSGCWHKSFFPLFLLLFFFFLYFLLFFFFFFFTFCQFPGVINIQHENIRLFFSETETYEKIGAHVDNRSIRWSDDTSYRYIPLNYLLFFLSIQFVSSPEPKAHKMNLKYTGIAVRRRSHKNISETTWPILIKFCV